MKYSLSTDLDGTLINVLPKLRDYFPNIPEQPKIYNLSEYLLAGEKTRFTMLVKSPYVLPETKFYAGALNFVNLLKDIFEEIYFVTSRDKGLERLTKKQLKDNDINFGKLLLEKDKSKVIPDLGVLIHIEDNPEELDRLKKYTNLYLLVPIQSWNLDWILKNCADFKVYPYKDFTDALNQIKHILELEGGK